MGIEGGGGRGGVVVVTYFFSPSIPRGTYARVQTQTHISMYRLVSLMLFVSFAVGGVAAVCPVGNAHEGARCVPCEAGTYAPYPDAAACLPCARGTSSEALATACVECGAGTVQPNTRASACATCPRYTVQPYGGRLDCLPCPPGTYANVARTECVPCAAGTAQDRVTGACVPCAAGRVAPDSASVACRACPVGTYANADATACTPCSTGYVTLGVEASKLDQCVDCVSLFNDTFDDVNDICIILRCAPYLSTTSPFIEARLVARWLGDGTMYASGGACEGLVEYAAPAGSPLSRVTPVFTRLDNETGQRVGLWLAQTFVLALILVSLGAAVARCRRRRAGRDGRVESGGGGGGGGEGEDGGRGGGRGWRCCRRSAMAGGRVEAQPPTQHG